MCACVAGLMPTHMCTRASVCVSHCRCVYVCEFLCLYLFVYSYLFVVWMCVVLSGFEGVRVHVFLRQDVDLLVYGSVFVCLLVYLPVLVCSRIYAHLCIYYKWLELSSFLLLQSHSNPHVVTRVCDVHIGCVRLYTCLCASVTPHSHAHVQFRTGSPWEGGGGREGDQTHRASAVGIAKQVLWCYR